MTINEAVTLAIEALQAGQDSRVLELLRPHEADAAGDATFWHVLGVARHRLGDFAGAQAAYESVLQLLPQHAGVNGLLGKIYYQQEKWLQAADVFVALLAQAPSLFEERMLLAACYAAMAAEQQRDGMNQQAEAQAMLAVAQYEQLLQFDASHPDVLSGLMQQLYLAGQYARTAIVAERLLQHPVWQGLAMSHLARSLMHMGMHAAAGQVLQQIAAWVEDDAGLQRMVLNEQALLALWRGDRAESVRLYDEAGVSQASAEQSAVLNCALSLLALGDYTRGWALYRTRRHFTVLFDVFNALPWRGEPLQGKTLLLHSEQGAGDMIQFLRFLPLLKAKGARVVFNAFPDILTLLAKSDSAEKREMALDELRWDYHARLMDIPGLLGITLDNLPAEVPYLYPATSLVELWAQRLAPYRGLRIGLVWAGNPGHGNDHNRSMSLQDFAPLAHLPGVVWFGLHKGQAQQEAATPPRGMQFVDLADELESFADTAAIIQNLDLVITVDTSVAHLAGALGRPVWVMLPKLSQEWRWLIGREDSPWYPSMRIFWQRHAADWNEVVAGQVLPALYQWGLPQLDDDVRVWWQYLSGRDDVNVAQLSRFAAQDAWARAAEALALQHRDKSVLEAACGEFSSVQPQLQPHAAMAWAQWFKQTGERSDLATIWQQLTQLDVAPVAHQAWLEWLQELHVAGDYTAVANQCQQALAAFPLSAALHFVYARACHFSGQLAEAETAYGQVLQISPRHANARHNLGFLYEQSGRIEQALLYYQQTVMLQPAFEMAWVNLGRLAHRQGGQMLAVVALEQAVAMRPDDVTCKEWLGNTYYALQRYAQALHCFERVQQMQPDSAAARLNVGLALQQLGRMDEALAAFAQALERAPGFAKAHFAFVWYYLARNQCEPGWRHFSLGTRKKESAVPEWRGDDLDGRSLLVYQDYGYGDFWQFVVLVRQLRGGRITLAVNHQALEMMQAQAAEWGIEVIQMDHLDLGPGSPYDFQINLMDLNVLFHTDLLHPVHHGAYLHAPRDKVAAWAGRLAGDAQLKVGIVWAGNAKYGNDSNRSTRLDDWLELAAVPGVSLYSLQKDKSSNQALNLPQLSLHNVVAECETLADTAAVMANLDLIITVDTGLAHLAAAMGRPVWVLLAARGTDWRWQLEREDCPWYPSVRLFRQGQDEPWSGVLARVAQVLRQRLGCHA